MILILIKKKKKKKTIIEWNSFNYNLIYRKKEK